MVDVNSLQNSDFITEQELNEGNEVFSKDYKGLVTITAVAKKDKEMSDTTWTMYEVYFLTLEGAKIRQTVSIPTVRPKYIKEGSKPTSFMYKQLKDWFQAFGLPELTIDPAKWVAHLKLIGETFSNPKNLIGKKAYVDFGYKPGSFRLDNNKIYCRVVDEKGNTVVLPKATRITEKGEVHETNVELFAPSKDALVAHVSRYGYTLNKLVSYPEVLKLSPALETPAPQGESDVHIAVESDLF